MAKTNYTMIQIKNYIKRLKNSCLNKFYEDILVEVEKLIKNDEVAYDLSQWRSVTEKANELYNKYNKNKYKNLQILSNGTLKSYIESDLREQDTEKRKNIEKQFESILSRLSQIRNPDKALEFLKLCNIELPETVKEETEVSTVNVDPEFIKSILPKCKMITE